jgi:predicted nucleotidyltransferase
MKRNNRWKTAIDEFIEEVKRKCSPEIAEILVYGSYARQEAEEESDVDLLVVVKEVSQKKRIEKETAKIANELSLKHDLVISVVVVDKKYYLNSFEPLLVNIRREGIKVA